MALFIDSDRQLRLVMFALNELMPGVVCLNSTCPTGETVPHMASDGGNHPHPYGLIQTSTHEWRRKPWWRRAMATRPDSE